MIDYCVKCEGKANKMAELEAENKRLLDQLERTQEFREELEAELEALAQQRKGHIRGQQRYIEQLENELRKDDLMEIVRAMVRAYAELNAIRARDGVPYMHDGFKSSVDEDYFSSVVDELNAAVVSMTGEPAHCHPALYKKDKEVRRQAVRQSRGFLYRDWRISKNK